MEAGLWKSGVKNSSWHKGVKVITNCVKCDKRNCGDEGVRSHGQSLCCRCWGSTESVRLKSQGSRLPIGLWWLCQRTEGAAVET